MNWYIAHVTTGQESKVNRRVRKLADTYLPRCIKEHGRNTGLILPYLPGYLFTRAPASWGELLEIDGVVDVLRGATDHYAAIPNVRLDPIYNLEADDGLIHLGKEDLPRFRRGERVVLDKLWNQEAVVSEDDGARTHAVMKLFRRDVNVQISRDVELRAAG